MRRTPLQNIVKVSKDVETDVVVAVGNMLDGMGIVVACAPTVTVGIRITTVGGKSKTTKYNWQVILGGHNNEVQIGCIGEHS
jgi:hypothetical protein